MNMDSILNGHLDINSVLDNSGRKYFNLKIAFSDQDALTIYRNSIDELLEDLPQIIISAVRARILNETNIQQ
ncbi:MAG: hypothetical protein KAS58_07980 [Calditrichia bacterium]|nr:hypothetical protein [Calditrichia bacterium]